MTCHCCRNISDPQRDLLLKIDKTTGKILWSRRLFNSRGTLEKHRDEIFYFTNGSVGNTSVYAFYPQYSWPGTVLDLDGHELRRIGEGYEEGHYDATGPGLSTAGRSNSAAMTNEKTSFSHGGRSTPSLNLNVFDVNGDYIKTIDPYLGTSPPSGSGSGFLQRQLCFSFGPYVMLGVTSNGTYNPVYTEGPWGEEREGPALFDSSGEYVGNVGFRSQYSSFGASPNPYGIYNDGSWLPTSSGVWTIGGARLDLPDTGEVRIGSYIPHVSFWSYVSSRLPTAIPELNAAAHNGNESAGNNVPGGPFVPSRYVASIEVDKQDDNRIIAYLYSLFDSNLLHRQIFQVLTRNGGDITYGPVLYPGEILDAAGFDVETGDRELFTPTIHEDVISFPLLQGTPGNYTVYLFGMSTGGDLLWQVEAKPRNLIGPGTGNGPFTDGEYFYWVTGSTDGDQNPKYQILLKINPADGEILWECSLPPDFDQFSPNFGRSFNLFSGMDPYRHQHIFDDADDNSIFLFNT